MVTDRGLVASRGMRLFTLILGCTPPVRKTVPGRTTVLYWYRQSPVAGGYETLSTVCAGLADFL